MDNDTFLGLIRDRAKKTSAFIEAAGEEARRQIHALHEMRLTLIAASAVTGAALGVSIALATGRR